MQRYDYIVVGGGSAGCIVAAELANDTSCQVLLLESGPPAEEHPETLIAKGYKEAFINDAVMGERFCVPQAHSAKQRIFAGTGTVMGGSGSVNGMVYTRGSREDYDEWPKGWHWDDIQGDFDFEVRIRGKDHLHGIAGEVNQLLEWLREHPPQGVAPPAEEAEDDVVEDAMARTGPSD